MRTLFWCQWIHLVSKEAEKKSAYNQMYLNCIIYFEVWRLKSRDFAHCYFSCESIRSTEALNLRLSQREFNIVFWTILWYQQVAVEDKETYGKPVIWSCIWTSNWTIFGVGHWLLLQWLAVDTDPDKLPFSSFAFYYIEAYNFSFFEAEKFDILYKLK